MKDPVPTPKDIAAARKAAKECPNASVHAAYLAGLMAGRFLAAEQAKKSIEHHYGYSGEVVVDEILRGPK